MAIPSFFIANIYVKAIMNLKLTQQDLLNLLQEIYSILPFNLNLLSKEKINQIPASHELKNLLLILQAKKHLHNLKLIFELFKKNLFIACDIKEVEFTNCRGLTTDETSVLKADLEKFFGTKIYLSVKKDESLLGGFTLFFNNFLIDNSKKSKIFKIKSCILK